MSASEYLPTEPKKVFHLEREPEHSPFEIKEEAKRDCCADDLEIGAKLVFCWLADNAWMKCFGGDGAGRSISISIRLLAKLLKVSEASANRWTKELLHRRYLWLSKKSMLNSRPQNVYHIRRVDPPPPDYVQPDFPDWGNRAHSKDGRFCKGWGDTLTESTCPPPNGKHAQSPAKPGGILSERPFTTVNVTAHNGQRDGGQRSNRPRRTVLETVDNGQPDGGERSIRPLATVLKTAVNGPKAYNKEAPTVQETEETLNRVPNRPLKRGGKPLSDRTKEFLADAARVLGAEDLGRNRGLYVIMHRQEAEKCDRVLAEVRRMQVENVPFTKSPAATFMYLWRQWR